MIKVLIQNNKAHEIFEGEIPAFSPAFLENVVEYEGTVTVGDNWDGTTFSTPAPYVPTYQEARRAEYPSIEDQLDDIFHNGVDGWKLTIQAIKDKYPKV